MTLNNQPVMDYGLDVSSFLDANLNKQTMLQKTINPNDTSQFGVLAISNYEVMAWSGRDLA